MNTAVKGTVVFKHEVKPAAAWVLMRIVSTNYGTVAWSDQNGCVNAFRTF